jgi:hypothetical protein
MRAWCESTRAVCVKLPNGRLIYGGVSLRHPVNSEGGLSPKSCGHMITVIRPGCFYLRRV